MTCIQGSACQPLWSGQDGHIAKDAASVVQHLASFFVRFSSCIPIAVPEMPSQVHAVRGAQSRQASQSLVLAVDSARAGWVNSSCSKQRRRGDSSACLPFSSHISSTLAGWGSRKPSYLPKPPMCKAWQRPKPTAQSLSVAQRQQLGRSGRGKRLWC